MRHAAEWADTWYPVPRLDDPTMEKAIPRFHAVCEEVGRDPNTIGIAVAAAPPDPAILEKYREQGIERAALWINPGTIDDTLRELDTLTETLHALQ